jgi:hypothetical protein
MENDTDQFPTPMKRYQRAVLQQLGNKSEPKTTPENMASSQSSCWNETWGKVDKTVRHGLVSSINGRVQPSDPGIEQPAAFSFSRVFLMRMPENSRASRFRSNGDDPELTRGGAAVPEDVADEIVRMMDDLVDSVEFVMAARNQQWCLRTIVNLARLHWRDVLFGKLEASRRNAGPRGLRPDFIDCLSASAVSC